MIGESCSGENDQDVCQFPWFISNLDHNSVSRPNSVTSEMEIYMSVAGVPRTDTKKMSFNDIGLLA